MIGIKVEKYKQIIPDNYFDRHAISVYDALKILNGVQAGYSIFRIGDQKSQILLNKQLHS